ncbi:hypothetical protein Bbelb_242770 [Branchiostoma belcheri]|nr:hypothetical protein Bbelb_242770 [Branchiostoma belcheri]
MLYTGRVQWRKFQAQVQQFMRMVIVGSWSTRRLQVGGTRRHGLVWHDRTQKDGRVVYSGAGARSCTRGVVSGSATAAGDGWTLKAGHMHGRSDRSASSGCVVDGTH